MTEWAIGLVWLLNAILLAIVVLLAVAMLAYAGVHARDRRRRRKCLSVLRKILRETWIERNVRTVETPPFFAFDGLTERELLDLERNRKSYVSRRVRGYLREILTNTGRTDKLEKTALGRGDKWHRIEALRCLGYINAPGTLQILARLLHDEDEDISYYSLLALGHLKTVPAAAALLEFMSERPALAYKIASLLEGFPPAAAGEVARHLESPNPTMRFWALKLLSKFKEPNVADTAERLTEDASPDVRAAACEYLGLSGARKFERVLLKRLGDNLWFVRLHAKRALERMGAKGGHDR